MSARQPTLDGFDLDLVHLPRVTRAEEAEAGEVRKALGMAQADQAADSEWKARVDQAIARFAKTRDERGELVRFTAEDVREIAGDPPDHPNAHGARFSAAARRGEIRKVAYKLATRASLHRHPLAVWQGVSRSSDGDSR